jgi:hypothetical protein
MLASSTVSDSRLAGSIDAIQDGSQSSIAHNSPFHSSFTELPVCVLVPAETGKGRCLADPGALFASPLPFARESDDGLSGGLLSLLPLCLA